MIRGKVTDPAEGMETTADWLDKKDQRMRPDRSRHSFAGEYELNEAARLVLNMAGPRNVESGPTRHLLADGDKLSRRGHREDNCVRALQHELRRASQSRHVNF